MIELDNIYVTKFQTKERFLVKKIFIKNDKVNQVWGIYENSPNLGICPLNPERLIVLSETKEIEFCKTCKRQLPEVS